MATPDPNNPDTTTVPDPSGPINTAVHMISNDMKQFQNRLFDGVNWDKTYLHVFRLLPKTDSKQQDSEGSARLSPDYKPIKNLKPKKLGLAQVDENAQAIKKLVKAHSKKLLKDNNLEAGWRSIIRICPTTAQGLQDPNGCGCGCS